MKALAKLERIAPAHLDSEFSFEFTNPTHLPNPLLKLDHADLGYGDKTVLHDITLSLESGARYGLLGVNGSGKSTFIKALAGKIDLLSGSIVRSEKLNIGYLPSTNWIPCAQTKVRFGISSSFRPKSANRKSATF